MKSKILSIILVFVFICNLFTINASAQSDQKVTIQLKTYNEKEKLFTTNSLKEITLSEAEKIKNKFLEIENHYPGPDKISEQLKLLNQVGAIPSNLTLDNLFKILEYLNHHEFSSSFFPRLKMVINGPMIVSHFTIGSHIYGIKTFKPWYYENFNVTFNRFLNQSRIDGVLGAMPMYVGFSIRPVYVNIVGFNITKSYSYVFFPFVECLVPCIGTSITFILNINEYRSLILFEYNLDVCAIGAFGGLNIRYRN